MSLYQEQLEEMLFYYQSIADLYQADLDNSPPGSLACQQHYGKNQFLHIYRDHGNRCRRVITKDIDLQQSLARKEFAVKALPILKENIASLQHAIDNIIPFDPDHILNSMTKGYAQLPREFFFDKDSLAVSLHLDQEQESRILRHRDWGKTPYHESTYYDDMKTMKTSRGQRVRSKSELLILEMHYHFGIDVHYDEELLLGSSIVVPDFTYQGEDGRLFFWEHMGMMNRSDYVAHNYDKLKKYYDAGIYVGDRLILTFDHNGSIDMGMIESTLIHEIIPRL